VAAVVPRIRVTGLTKHYRVQKRAAGLAAAFRSLFSREYTTVRAVDGIDLSIEAGERVGFLGPNGAGKTTTLKVLAGLLHPTSGEVSVDGHEPRRREDAFLRRITLVLGQKQQLLWDLPPADTFELNRAIYGVDRESFTKRTKELVELLEIGEVVKRPTRSLSLGERMKCELAAALLHRPRVLFLDEPTIGLDVSMQLAVREFIRRYNERNGATVLLTSHYMDDVASLCQRVLVIDSGKLRYDGDLAELVRSIEPGKRVMVRFGGPPLERELFERIGRVVELDASRAVVEVKQTDLRAAVSRLLEEPSVADLSVEDPPLEEVMRELFAHPAEEKVDP